MSVEIKVKLRASPEQLSLVMEHLDRAEAALDTAAKRRYTRHPFRQRTPLCLVCQRTDGQVSYEASPRNLSARGVSVLIGAFVHPQTGCQIALPKSRGESATLAGVVRWCRHISRSVHEVGIEFVDRIELGDFLGGSSREDRPEAAVSLSEFNALLERQALRLATLAREQRSLEELKREIERIRRSLSLQETAESEWVQ